MKEFFKMSVLFISGEDDSLVKAVDALKASKAVPRGELHIMKGCKHWPQKERLEEYAQAADDFITRIDLRKTIKIRAPIEDRSPI